MFRNLILDWSGTLVDDFGATLEATNAVFEHYQRPSMDRETFRASFRLPYTGFYEEFLPDIHISELEDVFRAAFRSAHESVTPLANSRAFLDWAQAAGLRLIVLTSMNTEAFQQQLRRFGFEHYFEASYSGIVDKRDGLLQVLELHDLDPQETAYVGDMVHDAEAAQHAGLGAVAVLSGYDSAQRLASCRPDLMVGDVLALADLMDRSSRQPSRPDEASQDAVTLRGLQLVTRIGVPDEERAEPQEVRAGVEITPRRSLSGLRDQIGATIDYAVVAQQMQEVAQERPRQLLETLAEELAAMILANFPAAAVRISLEKDILPNCQGVGVTLYQKC